MIEMVTPAWSMPQSVPPRLVSVRAVARITGRVNFSLELIITSAPRNSFQDVMNANRVTVTIAGTVGGMKIRRRFLARDREPGQRVPGGHGQQQREDDRQQGG